MTRIDFSSRLAPELNRACAASREFQHGLPGAMRSDNGAPFASARGVLGLSRLSSRWVALGIDLERSRPGCPQDNGGHERMHRDMSREVERSPGECPNWSRNAKPDRRPPRTGRSG